ncbi:MAG: hypothetical protein GXP32_04715 [Kiritimatiellaeota bacterium]|nr:hypothetical protein [Kiritimatiellota bacterium]
MSIKQIVNITRRKMDKGVIDALSKGLRRITSKKHEDNHLISMNAPPLAAKLDAACEIVFKILSSDVSNLTRADRLQVYDKAVQLLDEAIKTNFELACALETSATARQTQSLAVFLELLSNMMGATLAVLNTQITILNNQSKPFFSDLSLSNKGVPGLSTGLQSIEDDMRSSVNSLLKTVSAVMAKAKEKRCFKKGDKERYEKALLEFRRKLG